MAGKVAKHSSRKRSAPEVPMKKKKSKLGTNEGREPLLLGDSEPDGAEISLDSNDQGNSMAASSQTAGEESAVPRRGGEAQSRPEAGAGPDDYVPGSIAEALTGEGGGQNSLDGLFSVVLAAEAPLSVLSKPYTGPNVIGAKDTANQKSDASGALEPVTDNQLEGPVIFKERPAKDKAGRKTESKAKGGDSKQAKDQSERDPEREARSVFIGNLPKSVVLDRKAGRDLKKWLSQFGKVESIRFRSVAFANPKLPPMVAMAKKSLHEKRDSLNAYAVFETREQALMAVSANGKLWMGKHLRVDLANNKSHDTKNTVFVGGLPFDVEDEALYEMFSDCGEVTAVRVVRDAKLRIGTGIAYVKFKDRGSVSIALGLDGTTLQGRALRVQRAVDNRKAKTKTDSGRKHATQSSSSRFEPTSANGKAYLRRKEAQAIKEGIPLDTARPEWAGTQARSGVSTGRKKRSAPSIGKTRGTGRGTRLEKGNVKGKFPTFKKAGGAPAFKRPGRNMTFRKPDQKPGRHLSFRKPDQKPKFQKPGQKPAFRKAK